MSTETKIVADLEVHADVCLALLNTNIFLPIQYAGARLARLDLLASLCSSSDPERATSAFAISAFHISALYL